MVAQAAGEAPRPSFLDALRIQLRERAAVQAVDSALEGSVAQKVGRAQALRAEQQADLVVWVEGSQTGEAPVELVLYVIGGREGRALVEVPRFEAAGDPGIDRALALKVVEILDAVRAASEQALAVEAVAPPAPDAPVRLGALLELGAWARHAPVHQRRARRLALSLAVLRAGATCLPSPCKSIGAPCQGGAECCCTAGVCSS